MLGYAGQVQDGSRCKAKSPVLKQRPGSWEPDVDAFCFWRLSVWGVAAQGGLEQTTGSPLTKPGEGC